MSLSFFFTTALFIGCLLQVPTWAYRKNDCDIAKRCVALLEKGKECPLFPMVPGSIAEQPGSDGFHLKRLQQSVYFYSDVQYHALIVWEASQKRLLVVDFPRGPTSFNQSGTPFLVLATKSALNGRVPLVVDLVYSHRHLDHIGAAVPYFQFVKSSFPAATINVWGTLETKNFLLQHDSMPAPVPTKIISRTTAIRISKRLTIKFFILGGHTNSDLLVYIPPSYGNNDGIAYFVDVISPREVPFSGFTLTIDLKRYIDVHKKLLQLPFKFFISGHGRIGNRRDIRINLQYTNFVVNSIKKAAANLSPGEIQKLQSRVADPNDVAFGNGVWSFISIINLQVQRCKKDTIREWGCKLSAVDVFAESHCKTAAFYLLVDL